MKSVETLHQYMKELGLSKVRPQVFIKRVNIEYCIPIFVVGDDDIHSMTQFAWDDFEIFKLSDQYKIQDFLEKLLTQHEGIFVDITPLSFKRFQFKQRIL